MLPPLLRVVFLAIVIGIVAAAVPGITVHGGFLALLWIAVLFAVVNAVLGTIARVISLPLIALTLGLFLLVINAAMLGITARLTSHLDVDSFGAAVLGAFLIALATTVVGWLLPPPRPV